MTYKVITLSRAQKQLSKLPPREQQRIATTITSLKTDPFRGKKLQGDFEGAWAIRVWPYRIIYAINRNIVTVTVLRIGHRQGIYKA